MAPANQTPESIQAAKTETPATAAKNALGFGNNLINFENLESMACENGTRYQQAEPYPHAVIDSFLNLEVVKKIADEFPNSDQKGRWLDFNGRDKNGTLVQANKYHISDENLMGFYTQRLLFELKGARFLKFLETLTGIPDLIPDALNHGGGIHLNRTGALLKIHADFNRHPQWHLDRRLNLLLYLNESWLDSYGGALELWNKDMSQCASKIWPIAGRCVIFSTSSTSYHGHPDPLTCPEGVSRKSLALYYYTNRKPEIPIESTSTLWQNRPDID